jgi:ABC-2 type transport system ATP-binding protein
MGTSLILTTHYMEEATQLCDRIIIMDKGRFLAEGSLANLLSRMKMPDVALFTVEGTIPDEPLPKQDGFGIQWDRVKGKGRCELNNVATDMPLLFTFLGNYNLRLIDFEHIRPTLDDVFLSMTGRRLNEETE